MYAFTCELMNIDPERTERQQLIHDIRNALLVVEMGFEALKDNREDLGLFETLIQEIRQSGTAPLKEKIEALLELSQQVPESDEPQE